MVEVPRTSAGHLRASSLLVVGAAEKVAGREATTPSALRYGDVVLYPNLGQPLRPERSRPLTLFLTAWPAPERPAIDAVVEVLHDGRRVAGPSPTRLRADASGRVQLASSLPVERFAPGTYELRVRLSDGEDEQTRTAVVPIAP
jgi:hypothetical protein